MIAGKPQVADYGPSLATISDLALDHQCPLERISCPPPVGQGEMSVSPVDIPNGRNIVGLLRKLGASK